MGFVGGKLVYATPAQAETIQRFVLNRAADTSYSCVVYIQLDGITVYTGASLSLSSDVAMSVLFPFFLQCRVAGINTHFENRLHF